MRNSLRPESPTNSTARRDGHLLKALVALAALALLFSACGGDNEELDAGAEPDQDLPADDGDTGDVDEPTDDGEATDDQTTNEDGYQQTESQPDMISAELAPIDAIVVVDDQTIGVQYQNGSEPCALADVTVIESDTEIVVELRTGLHPNAAAMSCIAQVVAYEIQVPLDAPVGDRSITTPEL